LIDSIIAEKIWNIVPTGWSAPEIKHKGSLRASVTSELVLDSVRLPPDAVLPEVTGLRGPLSCLNEARFGIVFGVVGSARACLERGCEERNALAWWFRDSAAFDSLRSDPRFPALLRKIVPA